MTGRQFQQALDRLGLTKRGGGRRLFYVEERTMRRWRVNGPPNPVALCLALMIEHNISAAAGEVTAARLFKP